jgi:hypothetical protein
VVLSETVKIVRDVRATRAAARGRAELHETFKRLART